jgi:hypothetical protein
MNTIPPDAVNPQRRRLFGAAAAIAAAQLGLIRTASAEGASKSTLPAIKPGKTTSFAPLKQINAGVLNVGYAEAGPADGSPVLLLHGWPYDIWHRRGRVEIRRSREAARRCTRHHRTHHHHGRMPMVRHILTRPPTPKNSPAATRTG